MKNLFNFLFAYGQLGWKTRLSQRDHLYHQGRNALSIILFSLLAYAVLDILARTISGPLATLPQATQVALFWGVTILLALPVLYLAFATIKLTVLRLHDFNLSGWWLLTAFLLQGIDTALAYFHPALNLFFSTWNLVYLALLVWPAATADNRFGSQATNSTEGKPRIIRAVPLVLFFGAWLLGMVAVFSTLQIRQQTAGVRAELQAAQAQMEAQLQAVQPRMDNAPQAEPVWTDNAVPTTAPATISTTN